MIALPLLLAAAAQAGATPDAAVLALHNYGKCAATRQPTLVGKLLDQDYRSTEYGRLRSEIFRSATGCMAAGDRLSSTGLLLAGALAEGMMARKWGGALAANLGTPAQAIASRNESETMGLCVAMRAPAETAALFATTPASAEESAAIKPVVAQLPDCLAAGQQMTLNKPALRAVLALAAHRIAALPKAPAGASEAGQK